MFGKLLFLFFSLFIAVLRRVVWPLVTELRILFFQVVKVFMVHGFASLCMHTHASWISIHTNTTEQSSMPKRYQKNIHCFMYRDSLGWIEAKHFLQQVNALGVKSDARAQRAALKLGKRHAVWREGWNTFPCVFVWSSKQPESKKSKKSKKNNFFFVCLFEETGKKKKTEREKKKLTNLKIAVSMLISVLLVNSGFPSAISAKTQPTDHMSAAFPYSPFDSNTSGARYQSVWHSGVRRRVLYSACLAMPKSTNFKHPFRLSVMFWGLRSRCIMLLSCSSQRPESIWRRKDCGGEEKKANKKV